MTRKARYVAGGHLTQVPTHMTYSSVVSQETVRIGLLVAVLNGLELLAGDIQNAFLEALVHRGGKLHIWSIDIRDDNGDLVCTSRLTVMIVPRRG